MRIGRGITAISLAAVIALTALIPGAVSTSAVDNPTANVSVKYAAYQRDFESVQTQSDITRFGFRISQDVNAKPIWHHKLGNITCISTTYPALKRVALFFVDKNGDVAYKTDDFAGNAWVKGSARQANTDVLCVSYRDENKDDLYDIIVVSECQNDSGLYSDKTYRIGDVLFQNETGFFRDYRVADQINRFDMNKAELAIHEFLSGGKSMEFLFAAKTLAEITGNEYFNVLKSARQTVSLEKFGDVEIVPGFYQTTDQCYLIIYVVDLEGRVLWNFQPMRDYVNFVKICGIALEDVDGDGLTDMTLLAQYSVSGRLDWPMDYNVYLQRSGYFFEDFAFKDAYGYNGADDVDAIVEARKAFAVAGNK